MSICLHFQGLWGPLKQLKINDNIRAYRNYTFGIMRLHYLMCALYFPFMKNMSTHHILYPSIYETIDLQYLGVFFNGFVTDSRVMKGNEGLGLSLLRFMVGLLISSPKAATLYEQLLDIFLIAEFGALITITVLLSCHNQLFTLLNICFGKVFFASKVCPNSISAGCLFQTNNICSIIFLHFVWCFLSFYLYKIFHHNHSAVKNMKCL